MNRVLVIGDSCEDRFTYGTSDRLCPDIPAPVFMPKKDVVNSGMAGNVYENLRGFGLKCDLITNTEKVIKQRFIDEKTKHTFLRFDTNDKVKRVTFDPTKIANKNYEAIVIADYGKGFLHEQDITLLCSINDYVFLDTKKVLGNFCRSAKFIKINSPEFEEIKNKIDLKIWEDKLIVTLGDRGCMYYKSNGFNYFTTESVDVFDLTGAGDTFQAGLVSCYIETNNIDESIKFANDCAAKAVQKKGVVSSL